MRDRSPTVPSGPRCGSRPGRSPRAGERERAGAAVLDAFTKVVEDGFEFAEEEGAASTWVPRVASPAHDLTVFLAQIAVVAVPRNLAEGSGWDIGDLWITYAPTQDLTVSLLNRAIVAGAGRDSEQRHANEQ